MNARRGADDALAAVLRECHAADRWLHAFTRIGVDGSPTASDDSCPGSVAILIKDNIAQRGRPNRAGSLLDLPVAEASAAVVQALEARGDVVVGRTAMDACAMGFTGQTTHAPPVRNPWNRAWSAGGSSSGSAAAVAAGLVPYAVGTDTGGSIRVPAAMCGMVGFKPTHGRIETEGILPLAPSLDTVGVVAGSVADARRFMDFADGIVPERPADPVPLEGLTFGIPDAWMQGAMLQPAVAGAFRAAIAVLGHHAQVRHLREKALRPSPAIPVIVYHEAAQAHAEWYPSQRTRYHPAVAAQLDYGRSITRSQLTRARDWRRRAIARFQRAFEQVDLLVTPTVPVTHKPLLRDRYRVEGESVAYDRALPFFTSLVNQIGAPALTLPLRSPGAPAPSIQVVGAPGKDALVLSVGQSLLDAGVCEIQFPPDAAS